MLNIEHFILIDPKYTIQEVVRYLEDRVQDWLFHNSASDVEFSSGSLMQILEGPSPDFAGDVTLFKSGDADVLVRSYGIKAGSFLVNKFQNPQLPKDGGDKITWQTGDPATLVCTRNTEYEKPYFIFKFSMPLGAFGNRHKEVAAIAECLNADLEATGPSLLIEKIAKEAQAAADALQEKEALLNLHSIAEKIWKFVLETTTHFSDGSLTAKGEATKPLLPSLLKLTAATWASRFGYYGFENKRAIQYFVTRRETQMWEEVYSYCMKGHKSTWPAVVEILSQGPVEERYLENLLQFLADPNWPGSFEAWAYIYSLKEKALPAIDASIRMALECGDEGWVENLTTIRQMIN